MAKIELKAPLIQDIKDHVDGAQSVVLVKYQGLTVAQDTELRRTMREAGLDYKVYKNTYMRLAFKGTDFEKLDPDLDGPNAIAISKEDATAAARLLSKFSKANPALEIKSGIVEGEYYDSAAMKAVASIPARPELISRLLGSMLSPVSNFARVINQIAEKGGAPADAADTKQEAPAEVKEEVKAEAPAEAETEVKAEAPAEAGAETKEGVKEEAPEEAPAAEE